MEHISLIDRYKYARYNFFKWRYDSPLLYKILLAFSLACLTGLGAQVRVYLPFTPVPITAQVFFVLLSGVVLGKWFGGLTQGMYVGIGCVGMPWFADWKGGTSVVLGATGGYLIGFIISALIIGWFVDNYIRARTITCLFPLMLLGVGIIYFLGALQLSFVLKTNFHETMIKGVIPFIAGDIVKIGVASVVGKAITPKIAYNGEADVEKMKKWKLP